MKPVIEWYRKNEAKADLGIFVGGFLFDILTLSRPDDWLTLAQQAVYLALLVFILVRSDLALGMPSPWGQKVWNYKNLILHFVLGSLISLNTLFFFKSASLYNAFAFLFLLLAVLIINELPQFQKLGNTVKWILVSWMLICFCNLLVPIMVNHLGVLVFVLSLMLAAVIHVALYYKFYQPLELAKRVPWVRTVVGVYSVWILLYILNVIPPIPLALEKSGIYHLIEKQTTGYVLSYERAKWKFWESGAQSFVKRPGDEVYFFARIFAPKQFQDQIYTVWKFKDPKLGWQPSDKIPISLMGGRDQGFRIYSKKKNLQPGSWRVEVQTSDAREIGRIYFEVQESSEPRIEPFLTEVE